MSQQTSEEAAQVKLDVNKKAAHMCYPFSYSIDPLDRVIVQTDRITRWEFDIFDATPQGKSDALDVVIALGEKYNAYIFPVIGEDELIGWRYKKGCMTGYRIEKTYIDALSAAIQAIGGK